MWANVWYYLASQVIVLATAFILSLCFESPFIRLEKLWIGALLQAIVPESKQSGKQNGNLHGNKPAKKLDDIIDRLESEDQDTGHEESMKKHIDEREKSEIGMVHGDDKTDTFNEDDNDSKIFSGGIIYPTPEEHNAVVALADVHVESSPPTYDETFRQ